MPTPAPDDDRATPNREDGATFEVSRLRTRRGTRPLVAAVLLLFGVVVVLNALNHAGVDRGHAAPLTALESTPQPSPTGRPSGDIVTSKRMLNDPEFPAMDAPQQLVALDVRPAGGVVFVHGDVYSVNVREVVVSIEDGGGAVLAKRSVLLQTGSTAFRLGANARFDAMFDVSPELIGDGLSVHADAYDVSGGLIEAVEQRVRVAVVART